MNKELYDIIYKTLRKSSETQTNLASESAAIILCDSIFSAISSDFHFAKKRVRGERVDVQSEEQLNLFS